MGKLIYSMLMSLDGYVVDADGNFDWAAPDDQVHSFVNDLERGVGTHLFGRRMYEVLSAWETMDVEGEPHSIRDYQQIWHASDKIVYSTTLDAPTTANTRLERSFEPTAVRALKQQSERDLSIGGPTLAAHALEAGLVDECAFFFSPVVVGGGTPALPDGLRLNLELLEERRFDNGTVFVRYSL